MPKATDQIDTRPPAVEWNDPIQEAVACLGFCGGEGVERQRCEVRSAGGEGVSPPTGRGLGRVLCPSPEFSF